LQLLDWIITAFLLRWDNVNVALGPCPVLDHADVANRIDARLRGGNGTTSDRIG
jgi:hypothetical protein